MSIRIVIALMDELSRHSGADTRQPVNLGLAFRPDDQCKLGRMRG